MEETIKAWVLETVETSIHSGLHVRFYFATKENALLFKNYIEYRHIPIEWNLQYLDVEKMSTCRAEIKKDPLELARRYTNWAASFAEDHGRLLGSQFYTEVNEDTDD